MVTVYTIGFESKENLEDTFWSLPERVEAFLQDHPAPSCVSQHAADVSHETQGTLVFSDEYDVIMLGSSAQNFEFRVEYNTRRFY